jgi:hypothetical protein
MSKSQLNVMKFASFFSLFNGRMADEMRNVVLFANLLFILNTFLINRTATVSFIHFHLRQFEMREMSV